MIKISDVLTEDILELLYKTAKGNRVTPKILITCIRSLKLAQLIQESNPNFILYGGTATQLFFDNSIQRASIDVDMITNIKKKEVEKIIKSISVQNDIPFNLKNKKASFLRFSAPSRYTDPSKLDIVCNVKSDIDIEILESTKMFEIPIGKIKTVKKTSLIPLKLLPLNLGSCGLDDERIKKVPKYIYDIYFLGKDFTSTELEESFKQLKWACRVEKTLEKCKKSEPIENCMNNIIKNLDIFSKMDIPVKWKKSDNSRGYLWKKTFNNINSNLPSENRILGTERWIEMIKEIELMVHFIKLYIINNDTKASNKFLDAKKECDINSKNGNRRGESLDYFIKEEGYPRSIKSRTPLTVAYMKYITDEFT